MSYGRVRGVYLPRLADAAASSMATYGIPLLVLSTTNSSSLTGAAFMLAWAPRLCTFSLAGMAVDRFGPARVFRLAASARALVGGLAVPALAMADDRTASSLVMLLAACAGCLTQFSFIAAESVGAMASRDAGDGAHRVQSVLLGIDQAAALVGPAAGGLLLQWGGSSGMLLVISAMSLLSAAIAPGSRQSPPQPPEATGPAARGWRTGWSTLRALPTLAWLVAGLALSNLALGLLEAATPVIVVQELGQSSASVGLVWSCAAVASLLAVATSRVAIDRWGLTRVGRCAALVAIVPCFLIAHADSYPAYLILAALFLAGDSVLAVVLRTLRSHLIPAEVFGSTLSVTVLILLVPYPLAGVLMAVVEPGAIRTVITICAALQCLGLLSAFTLGTRPRPRHGKHRR
ncbi:MFS transporter [Streptomyces pactum]|uniref:MFS transporter n=1 Tax=Streptomyces pactum TaxID=68249 RepID=A0A1S6J1V9_9ACTN|nr:MFS transporter [Streptomyces pactum]AQS65746.1 MFS transporter [Streptomyces pactum]